MSSTVTIDPFEAMIREAGQGHLIDLVRPTASAMPQLRRMLANADSRARERFGGNAPSLTPDAMVHEFRRNPHKVRAFLQVLPWASSEMLVMVWRILQGMGIASLHVEYDAGAAFKMHVRLTSPYDAEPAEEYASTDIDDAVVLRHLGIMKMGEQPIFDGFYALNLSGA